MNKKTVKRKSRCALFLAWLLAFACLTGPGLDGMARVKAQEAGAKASVQTGTEAGQTATTGDGWIGAWSTTPVKFNLKEILELSCIKKDIGLHNLMFRTRIQPTVSGEDVRLTLSNEFGTGPLTVQEMTVAKGCEKVGSAYQKKTKKQVTFQGAKSVTIPAGETVTSDPVGMSVSALEYLTVSSFLKNTGTMKTYGLIGGDTYISTGNRTHISLATGVPMRMEGDFGEYSVIPLLTDVEVYHPQGASAVLIGDSTIANDIPLLLADRLQKNGITDWGILQQAVKGNRLLADGAGKAGMIYGESVKKRFTRDVLEQPGVKMVFLKVGDNDIIHPNCKSMAGIAPAVTAKEMIAGYGELIRKAHEQGIRVYLFTRTAWRGYTRNLLGTGDDITWTPELDAMRKEINDWIRSADCPADGVIDLDFMCNDEEKTQLRSGFTTDGVHFTPAGQQAVTDAVPLEIFSK